MFRLLCASTHAQCNAWNVSYLDVIRENILKLHILRCLTISKAYLVWQPMCKKTTWSFIFIWCVLCKLIE